MQFKASVIEQKSIITIKQFILKIFFSEFVFLWENLLWWAGKFSINAGFSGKNPDMHANQFRVSFLNLI